MCITETASAPNLCGISVRLFKNQRNDGFSFHPHSKYTQLQPSFYGRVGCIFIYLFLFVAFCEPALLCEESTNKDEVSFIIILLKAVFVLLLHVQVHVRSIITYSSTCSYYYYMFKVDHDHNSPTGRRNTKKPACKLHFNM